MKEAQLIVFHYDGINWTTVGGTGLSEGEAYCASLSFDSNDYPYVAYLDALNNNRVRVMKYDNTNWVTIGGTSISAGEANNLFLVIGSYDIPFIAYIDGGLLSSITKVMKYYGSGWQTIGSDNSSWGTYTAFALDSENVPYIAFDARRGSQFPNNVTILSYR